MALIPVILNDPDGHFCRVKYIRKCSTD